jgi:hypothetical protein
MPSHHRAQRKGVCEFPVHRGGVSSVAMQSTGRIRRRPNAGNNKLPLSTGTTVDPHPLIRGGMFWVMTYGK